MLCSKMRELKRMKKGLHILTTANEDIDKMKTNAKKQQEELQIAQADADEVMTQISNELSKSQLKRKETEQLKADLAVKSSETLKRKRVIEEELQSILPSLNAAKEAVEGIKRENLDEIRSLKTPPSPIIDVLSGVLMLLGINDLTWLSMKKFLGQRGIKDDILNFKADDMAPGVAVKVDALVNKKSQSFDSTAIKKVSAAAAPLAAWVKAILQYARVLNNVKPLQAGLSLASQEVKLGEEEVENCDNELTCIDENVQHLREKFSEQVHRAELLKESLRLTKQRLETASEILRELKVESSRWHDSVALLEKNLTFVWVESLLISAFTIYLASKDSLTRSSCFRDLLGIIEGLPDAFVFDLVSTGTTEIERITWRSWGLPPEKHYIENALIISKIEEKVSFVYDLT